MFLLNNLNFRFVLILVISGINSSVRAQQVTGVWNGQIDKKNVELKIVQNGDSLTGTSYYYESATKYRRYTIKGYFDADNNSVVWWDDQLISNKGTNSGKNPLLSVADFNCPGGGEMYLDGKAAPKERPDHPNRTVNLTKVTDPSFPDEWDFVIDNYTIGANDPEIIDSVFLIAITAVPAPEKIEQKPSNPEPRMVAKPPVQKTEPFPIPIEKKIETRPLTVEEKFTSRKKLFTKEIPIEGDSIELRFYDNAEIDGDSISLFLNDHMIFTHVRLTDKAYTIKLPVKELNETNELIMVAENLGSIPPNTSYMLAIMGDKRYEAYLASSENSSAMIRLRKQ